MRRKKRIMKWFLKISLVLIIFTFGIIFIFLLRPQYFLNDIEILIENQISSQTPGNLEIEHFKGNFIKGFRIYNIQYKEEDEILFSASEMFIDPDLSRIIFGEAVLSEVILVNSYYKHNNLQIQEKEYSSSKLCVEIGSDDRRGSCVISIEYLRHSFYFRHIK